MMDQVFIAAAKDWLKQNRNKLQKYAGEWIAYNGEDGLIMHHKKAGELIESADKTSKKYIIKFLHPYVYGGLPRLLPVRFRSLRGEIWEPTQPVTLKYKDNERTLDMLVDSGADFSAISHAVGQQLGFYLFEGERPMKAAGVGGTIAYVIRDVQMELAGFTLTAPVGWFVDEGSDDLLLGREVVFDFFDIEFKQKDEQIIFNKRMDAPV